MINSMFILGVLGWILTLILLFYLYREEKVEEEHTAIHSSAIEDGRVFKMFRYGFIEGNPVMSEEDYRKFYAENDNNLDKEKEIQGVKISIYPSTFLETCKSLNCKAVVSGDARHKLEMLGIDCVDIGLLDNIDKRRINKGQKIEVEDIEYGYRRARGFLKDGSTVIIVGRLPEEKPQSLKCTVESVLEGKLNRKIWATISDD